MTFNLLATHQYTLKCFTKTILTANLNGFSLALSQEWGRAVR